MEKEFNAITTVYNGYRFRSRLEARWAVFFDSMGISYQYESEGFEVDTPDGSIRYLPDFYLPDLNLWVEVKGGRISIEDATKLAWMIDYSSPLEGVFNSEESRVETQSVTGGLLLLGGIPDPSKRVSHTLLTHSKGIYSVPVSFGGEGDVQTCITELGRRKNGEIAFDYNEKGCIVADGVTNSSIDTFFDTNYHIVYGDVSAPPVAMSYKKARQARFEHGETPVAPSAIW